MGVNTFYLLCLALATKFMLAQSDIDQECVYEGQRFKADRRGQLPVETHRRCLTEIECKDKCDAKPTCIIWQWQPTRKICWLMNVVTRLSRNSDFGINNCKKGKPTENAPICQVTKGDRDNVWKDYRNMAKEECIAKCVGDSDCLVWQHIRNRKLCRIHKLEIDLSKKSQVGIHYCSSKPSTSNPYTNETLACTLSRTGCCPTDEFDYLYLCKGCQNPAALNTHAGKVWTKRNDKKDIVFIGFHKTKHTIIWKKDTAKNECVGKYQFPKMSLYECKFNSGKDKCKEVRYIQNQECEIRAVQDELKAVHCIKNNGDWTKIYTNEDLYDSCSIELLKKHLCNNYVNKYTVNNCFNGLNSGQAIIMGITKEVTVEKTPFTNKDGHDGCTVRATLKVYECDKRNKPNPCMIIDNFPTDKSQKCELQITGGVLNSITCAINGNVKQIYPKPTPSTTAAPAECDPNKIHGRFFYNHVCFDDCGTVEEASEFSNERGGANNQGLPPENTVISPEQNSFNSAKWFKANNGASCVGMFKAYIFRCNLQQDYKYRCVGNSMQDTYQDCSITAKIASGHLEKIVCNGNQVKLYT